MGGGGLDQLAIAGVGQHGLHPPAVGLTRLAAYEIRVLHASDGVGHPAPGVRHRLGQERHPHPAVLGFGESDKHLVLREGDLMLLPQLAIELMLQQLGAHDVRAPGPLLLRIEPANFSPRTHGGSVGRAVHTFLEPDTEYSAIAGS
jgi:hypothetical protein